MVATPDVLDAIGRSVLPTLEARAARAAATIQAQRALLDEHGIHVDGDEGAAWVERMRLLEDVCDAAYRYVHTGAGADELRVAVNRAKGLA